MFRYGKFSALCEGRWSVPIGSRGGPKKKKCGDLLPKFIAE